MEQNNILKEYNLKAEKLNKAFNELSTANILPVKHGDIVYDINTINTWKNNLQKQEFTISVCGQINAGKSSFLNFLLFNDKEILPADDTPWTAKLTTVRYGKENMAEVIYYSTSEWDELKAQKTKTDEGEEDTYYNQFLKKDVNKVAEKGIQIESYIYKNNKVEKNIKLSELTKYVTKGGLLTPFVKEVDIKINNELAKGVVFVDTPGLNDRNELRSKITENWINQSCAVIYLFYTGQALSLADYDFIDQHLSTIPTDRIIFALTKADTSEDYESAKQFVETSLAEDEELKKRDFIKSTKKVYPISTMAALLNYKIKNNIPLSDGDKFHKERIDSDAPSYINNNGYVPQFVDGLKTHLMQNTGKAILDKAMEGLKSVYEIKLVSLKSDKESEKEKLKSIGLNKEELKKKEENLNDILDKTEDLKTEFKEKSSVEIGRLVIEFAKQLERLEKNELLALNQELEESSNGKIEAIRSLVTHITKKHLEKASNTIKQKLLNETSIEAEIENLIETYKIELYDIIKEDVVVNDKFLSLNLFETKELVDSLSYSQLSLQSLKDKCGKVYIEGWFGYSGINKEDVVTKISVEVKKVFETHFKYIRNQVETKLKNKLDSYLNVASNDVSVNIKKYQSALKQLENEATKKDDLVNVIRTRIVELQKEYDFINDKYKNIKNELN